MQGINLFSGNDQYKLANELEKIIIENPLPPMQEELIVVQTKGLERWFRLRFANRHVICGGMKFLSPVGFIQAVSRTVFGDRVQESIFDGENLKWALYNRLKTVGQEKSYEKVRNYINENELKAFKLSEKIADLFDQYLVYRPDMIDAWTKGATTGCGDDELWQKDLWEKLVSIFGDDHALNRHTDLLSQIPKLEALPFKRVSFFLTSSLLPSHLAILETLSKKMEVNLFFFDPGAKDYWLEDLDQKNTEKLKHISFKKGLEMEAFHLESGNEILHSWGMMGKAFLKTLSNFHFYKETDCLKEDHAKTLLSCIQSDIFENFNRSFTPGECKFSKTDDSLMITSAHSNIREIEILHDYLLSCFDDGGAAGLKPDDVLVMVPDIDDYAPLIDAIFANPAVHQKIPYSIADALKVNRSSCSAHFINLLNTIMGRFEVSSIISLLEFQPIRQKFDIQGNEIEHIKTWLVESGIRWGIDGVHRQEYGLHPFEENTWAQGLDRMLMGYAVGDEQMTSDVFPYTCMEGDAPSILGNLLDFFHALKKAYQTVKTKTDLITWKQRLLNVLSDFFMITSKTEREIEFIERSISKLETFYSLCQFKTELPLEIIKLWLNGYMEKDSSGLGFISGGVTFCSMIPMRAIPFRVICIMGLNDNDFPRKEIVPGFNLMAKNSRPLDRDIKKSDRYLFLEALLSAKERLYLSYHGRSIKDNSEKQPSIMISELLDHVHKSFGLSDLVQEHPLRSFSKDYFSGEKLLFSYSNEDAETAASYYKNPSEPIENRPSSFYLDSDIELPLDVLLDFFKNPMKFFLTKERGVYFKTGVDTISDEELFELNSLERYVLQEHTQNWKDRVQEKEDEDYVQLNAKGQLPHGNIGKMVFQKTVVEVEDLLKKIEEELLDTEEVEISGNMEFSIDGKTFALSGTVKNIYGHRRVFFRPTATAKGKDIVELWLNHLFINSLKGSIDSVFFGKGGKPFPIRGFPKNVAKKELENMLQLFLKYRRTPMPFIPSVSFEYALTNTRNPGTAAVRQAENAWKNDQNFDNQDRYFNICMRHFDIF